MGIHMIGRAAATAGLLAAMMIPSTASSQIIVRGVLYDDATGDPVRGTVMLVDPSKDTPVVFSPTDSLGQFSLQAANGVYQIAAIRPGYTSVLSVPVPFENGEQLTIRIPIAVTGDPQHRIGVVERLKGGQNAAKVSDLSRKASLDNGFDSRRRLGTGLQFDRTRIEKANVLTLGEFLRHVPGLSVVDPNSTATMQMTRGGSTGLGVASTCHLGWFLDGHRVDAPGRVDPLTDGLGSMQMETIEAVEVFRGVSEMPPEFAAPDLGCGAVAIWTRRG